MSSESKSHLVAIPILLVCALLLFLTSVFFPFFNVTKLWVFHDAVSVFSGIITLFDNGEYFLFGVLTLFALVFPLVKLGLLTVIWIERNHDLAQVRSLHKWVENVGRWSMLDVFVVAILIVVTKSAALADIKIGIGLYLFTFSVIFTQFASSWIDRLLNKHD